MRLISFLFIMLVPLAAVAIEPDSSQGRIVSLSPSITEILFELGLGDRVIGVTRYCDFPDQANAIAKVGGYFDPNYEVILSLQPDLVIMLNEHEQARNQLSQFNMGILTVNHKTVSGILESLTLIGEACGAVSKANQVLADIQDRLARVQECVRGLPAPKVVISIGRSWGSQSIRQLHLVGNDGFFSEIITSAGGKNAYDGPVPFPEVSREGLLFLDPDIIIDLVPDMQKRGFETDRLLAEWDSFSLLRAVKQKNVVIFGEGFMAIPGPRFITIIETLAKTFHPEMNCGDKP